MTTTLHAYRRRATRPGSARRVHVGAAARGLVVVAGIVGALVLQLAGPRLQGCLADLMGATAAVPGMPPAAAPGCGSPSGANTMHPCKVATTTFALTGIAPVI